MNCPVCGKQGERIEETEIREKYLDGSIAKPNDPRRIPLRERRSVPGSTTVRWEPCGHIEQ